MFIALRALTLLLLVSNLAFAKGLLSTDSLRTEQKGDQMFVVHQVEQKETLFSLSRRYGASVEEIRLANDLSENAIDIDQIIYIPVKAVAPQPVVAGGNDPVGNELQVEDNLVTHTVRAKETLFSISRQYGVTIDELRLWNGLTDNSIDIGQNLRIAAISEVDISNREASSDDQTAIITPVPVGSDEGPELPTIEKKPALEEVAAEEEPVVTKEEPKMTDLRPKYFHYVQAGETLRSISRKFKTEVDSLVVWNELSSDQLTIGQKILIRKQVRKKDYVHRTSNYKKTQYGSKKWVELNEGRLWVREEGIAGIIDGDVGTTKYLALHRSLPVGTEMKVLNLMNHREIKVKVVGKLPETGLNRNVMIRLTSVSFKELGILDPKSRVELSYVDFN